MIDPISFFVALMALASGKAKKSPDVQPSAPKPPAKPTGKVTTLPEVVIKAKPPAAKPKPKPAPSIVVPNPAIRPQSKVVPAVFKQAPARDLPKFPDGWEPDVPVPADVQARATALLGPLWKSGKPGVTKQEQTGDHWVTYKSFVPAKGKKGVAAYRVKPGLPGEPPPTSPNV